MVSTHWPVCRSALYVPGSNAKAIAKAETLDSDAIIFDLEDAVSEDSKTTARNAVRDALRSGRFRGRKVVVRINALGSAWCQADLEMVRVDEPDAVLLPKVSTPADLHSLHAALEGANGSVAVWAMMETPRAALTALTISDTARERGSRLAALVVGTNDLAKETGVSIKFDRAAMLPWLSNFVAAARANGLTIMDGVYNNLADEQNFLSECLQGRNLGMDGKTLIHPRQITVCNEVFSLSAEELQWARKVIDAFSRPEADGKGAIKIGDEMVERLHLSIATRMIASDHVRVPGAEAVNLPEGH